METGDLRYEHVHINLRPAAGYTTGEENHTGVGSNG